MPRTGLDVTQLYRAMNLLESTRTFGERDFYVPRILEESPRRLFEELANHRSCPPCRTAFKINVEDHFFPIDEFVIRGLRDFSLTVGDERRPFAAHVQFSPHAISLDKSTFVPFFLNGSDDDSGYVRGDEKILDSFVSLLNERSVGSRRIGARIFGFGTGLASDNRPVIRLSSLDQVAFGPM